VKRRRRRRARPPLLLCTRMHNHGGSRFARTGQQRQAAPEVVTGGGRALTSALIHARQSGHLKLRGRALATLPAEVLDIASVSLPEGSAWWETREFLETLDASQNELVALPEAFGAPTAPDPYGRPEPHPLEQLRELNLSHNRLSLLPTADRWRPLASLVNLALGNNALSSLPEGFGADNLPPLVRLDASHNSLGALPRSFGGLCELVELDLSHNALGELPPGLSAMRTLKKLLLGRNRLSVLPRDLLERPPPLIEVDISENRLRELAFHVGTVHTLQLANNQLQALDLRGAASLQELSAPYNSLGDVPSGLARLPRLSTIDVGNNKITSLEALVECASLTRVDVSNNEVREVPPLLGNLALNRLALTGNPLRTMPSAMLTAPTPKLLAHLRGKIVDAAPQWEGDRRAELENARPTAGAANSAHSDAGQIIFGGGGCGGGVGGGVPMGGGRSGMPPMGGGGGGGGEYGYPDSRGHGHPHRGARPTETAVGVGGGAGGFGRAALGASSRVPPSSRGPSGFDALYNRPPSDRGMMMQAGSARTAPGGGGAEVDRQSTTLPANRGGTHTAAAAAAAAHARTAAAPYQVEPPPGTTQHVHSGDDSNGLERYLQKEGTELIVGGGILAQETACGGRLPSDGYTEGILKIDASANKLASLPEGLYEALPALTALDVSRNALSELPIDLCECMQLKSLRASHNRLTDLSFVAQRPLGMLTELVCDRNGIVELPAYLWGCPRLAHVSLCANKLTVASLSMPRADHEGVAVAPLEHLDLGENRLGELPPLALFPRLREVHVQQNGIRELPVAQLAGLRLLQTLDLSMNDVSGLPPQLALLPMLQNLTIIGNPIRSIPQSVQQRGATAVIDLLRKRLPEQ
jgi:Leucine-rich repeat (LRR) protein